MNNLQSIKLIDANKLIDDLYKVAFEDQLNQIETIGGPADDEMS